MLKMGVAKYPFKTRNLAGGLGFEPRQPESESGVLPLDDPPMQAPTNNAAALDTAH
jgi:hypothetical protein